MNLQLKLLVSSGEITQKTFAGTVKKLDEYDGEMVLADGTVITLERILSMEEERYQIKHDWMNDSKYFW